MTPYLAPPRPAPYDHLRRILTRRFVPFHISVVCLPLFATIEECMIAQTHIYACAAAVRMCMYVLVCVGGGKHFGEYGERMQC